MSNRSKKVTNNKICVFIPTYCCETQIIRTINQLTEELQNLIDTIIVIDNCSTDSTLDNAIREGQKKIKISNFMVLQNLENYGLGGSHKSAFLYAIKNKFDYIVVLHGDDQASIDDLKPILISQSYTKYDCLLGARFMRGSRLEGYSLLRTYGNIFFNILFSLITFRIIYDLGSGLNIYKIDAFKNFFFSKFPDDLTFNYVMLLGCFRQKLQIYFFPITWREQDQRSNVKLFNQSIRVLKILANYLVKSNYLDGDLRSISFSNYKSKIVFSSRSSL